MIIEPPQAFVFMKVGSHAGESLNEIVKRKQRELSAAGRIYWGYGGGPCHPITQVRPFAQEWVPRIGTLQILMQQIDSGFTRNHPARPARQASEFSVDGKEWHSLPAGVVITGSKYALVLGEEIRHAELDLDLGQLEVGIGSTKGRNAARYIRSRVDKGCLVATPSFSAGRQANPTPTPIAFQARLVEPYAVLLR